MTTEYEAGHEDIYIVVGPAVNAMVRFSVHRISNDEKVYGFVLPAEVARGCAEKLTIASFTSEEWHENRPRNNDK